MKKMSWLAGLLVMVMFCAVGCHTHKHYRGRPAPAPKVRKPAPRPAPKPAPKVRKPAPRPAPKPAPKVRKPAPKPRRTEVFPGSTRHSQRPSMLRQELSRGEQQALEAMQRENRLPSRNPHQQSVADKENSKWVFGR